MTLGPRRMTAQGHRDSRRETMTREAEFETLQNQSFSYFFMRQIQKTSSVIDKTAPDWPASITATGFALAAYPVAVEHGFMTRATAVERTQNHRLPGQRSRGGHHIHRCLMALFQPHMGEEKFPLEWAEPRAAEVVLATRSKSDQEVLVCLRH